jgi:NAD-dependent dihydropyrimidine dehydrogenase PreA subunit
VLREVNEMPDVKIDLAKCEGAGICADVCPMNVYDIVDVKGKKHAQATRAQDCISCMACVSACPASAITVE